MGLRERRCGLVTIFILVLKRSNHHDLILVAMRTWSEIIAANPQHSANYADRWKQFAAEGKDIVGEARLIDAMAPRGAKILDAGCGTGRIGGYLASCGHRVTGTDLDPYLVGVAQRDFPDVAWHVGDLTRDAIPESNFDLAVVAGNVFGFIEPEGREAALHTIHAALAVGGRAVIGFGAGRGLAFGEFFDLCVKAGFCVEGKYSTWELDPFSLDSNFLVAVLRK